MKVLEWLVLCFLKSAVADYVNHLQFEYSKRRCTENAIPFILNNIFDYLDETKLGNTARIMFIDFSSAFNTIQLHIFGNKLRAHSFVPHSLIRLILDYLTQRSQFVKLYCLVNLTKVASSVGAPQGTVLARFLFTVYTVEARSSPDDCLLVKYADDSTLIGLIKKDQDLYYRDWINKFVKYCELSHPVLNVSKTKEIFIDFRILE